MAFENRRAILADITDHALNPKEKHATTKNGRLQVITKALRTQELNEAAKEAKKEQQTMPVVTIVESIKDVIEVPQEIIETSIKTEDIVHEQPEVVKFDVTTENAKLEKKNKGKFKKSLV
jgi:hypothetical protein